MKNNKVYLIILIVLLIITLIAMCYLANIGYKADRKRDLPQIIDEGRLNIVTQYNTIDFHVAGDSIAGIQYELCKFIANRSGIEVAITLENNLQTAIAGLNKNRYDIIALNIPITSENKEYLAFTNPIAQDKQVLIQRKQSIDSLNYISNQIELANKAVYIPKGSPVLLRLKNLSEEIAEPIHITEVPDHTAEQLIYRVAFGDITYAVVDKTIALSNIANFPEIDMKTDISFTQYQAWAIRKSSPLLLDSLNVWIEEFKKR